MAAALAQSGPLAPPSGPLQRALRRAVLEHARCERRRRHLPLLHIGVPGAREVVHPIRPEEPTDHALRSDIVAAMVRRLASSSVPLVWLTRTGELDTQDIDVDWLAAARQSFGETGLRLVFVVVNRHGWRDPRSGVSRHWDRFRLPPTLRQ